MVFQVIKSLNWIHRAENLLWRIKVWAGMLVTKNFVSSQKVWWRRWSSTQKFNKMMATAQITEQEICKTEILKSRDKKFHPY